MSKLGMNEKNNSRCRSYANIAIIATEASHRAGTAHK